LTNSERIVCLFGKNQTKNHDEKTPFSLFTTAIVVIERLQPKLGACA
jgi:hypothetical protein